MLPRTLLFTSLATLCLAGSIAVGCAAPAADDEADVAESSDELSAAASQLVGKYYGHATAPRQLGRLALNADGTYTAEVDITDVAFCITSPCLGPEHGRWNASRAGGKLRLRLRAEGQPSRWYDAAKAPGQLALTRAGQTQTLHALDDGACLDDGDCGAGETCGPKMCLMYCEIGDPFCCGPSTCEPKAPPSKLCGGFANLPCDKGEKCVDDPSDDCDPSSGGADCGGVCVPDDEPPPPPSCAGAWLDQNGTCRTPADGVYPDTCCAGQTHPCGPSDCGVGEVCCNPLAGICTQPGDVCAF